jgi:hypothetical protein
MQAGIDGKKENKYKLTVMLPISGREAKVGL